MENTHRPMQATPCVQCVLRKPRPYPGGRGARNARDIPKRHTECCKTAQDRPTQAKQVQDRPKAIQRTQDSSSRAQGKSREVKGLAGKRKLQADPRNVQESLQGVQDMLRQLGPSPQSPKRILKQLCKRNSSSHKDHDMNKHEGE